MTHNRLLLALAAILAGSACPALGDDACAGKLAAGDTGKTVEERIQFLRSGQGTICPRSLEAAKCEEDFNQMIQALEDAKREAREACSRLAGRPAGGAGASSFKVQQDQLGKMRASLEKLEGHFSTTQDRMQAIRQHALRSVIQHLDSKMVNLPLEDKAKDAVFAAAYPNANVDQLRARVLELNVPAHHQDVNTLWVAVNALELEQYSGRQVARLQAGIAEAGRTGGEASGRQDRMGSVNSSGSSNPLGGLLSSPALPGLLGAAAQLAAASQAKSGASSPLPEQGSTGATSRNPGGATAPPPLASSMLDDRAKDQPSAGPPGGDKKEEEKKTAELPPNLPTTYHSGSSGISSEERTGGGPRGAFAAAAAKAPSSGGGMPGGGDGSGPENEGGEGKSQGRDPASDSRQSAAHSAYGDSGGGGGGSSFSESSSSNAPSTPAADALATILADGSGDSSSEEESQAAPETPTEASEASLFVIVHAAYVRGLKDGRLDTSKTILDPSKTDPGPR